MPTISQCSSCGKDVAVGRGSLPEPTCRQCRSERRKHLAAKKNAWKAPTPCATCGEQFTPRHPTRKYCSTKCKDRRVRGEGVCALCGEWFPITQSDGGYFCSVTCSVKARAPYRQNLPHGQTELEWRTCVQCDSWFISRRNSKYCSDDCRVRRNIDKGLGQYRLAAIRGDIRGGSGWFRRLVKYLAHRDGTKCAICTREIDISLPSGPRGNRLGPSIDHVIPRSQGGPDVLSNVRLTHWSCNQQRGNRGGDEQLRLIG